jgi:serine/threonine protein kinase
VTSAHTSTASCGSGPRCRQASREGGGLVHGRDVSTKSRSRGDPAGEIERCWRVTEGWADGIHFLTMQLVEGQPLDRLIPEHGLPIERIVGIATALSDALASAHEKGIVHRDLKPANVMVTPEGRVKVLDFTPTMERR